MKKIDELEKELLNKQKELDNVKENYKDIFKNYQNTLIELKEKEKIYKNFQNKIAENKKEFQEKYLHLHQSNTKSRGINYNDKIISNQYYNSKK